ncbi:MAG: hypothetical protein IJN80_04295 [Clostridia bacterium]|nr:hypothetical protein [Clostridia bacterium]
MRQRDLLVVANYSKEQVKIDLPEEIKASSWKRILTNRENLAPSLDGRKEWTPWEVEVYTLTR